jgi:hypothetical protein
LESRETTRVSFLKVEDERMLTVPTDPRPQYSQMMLAAKNMDSGREPMAGARQVGPDRYVLEEDPRRYVIGRVPGRNEP